MKDKHSEWIKYVVEVLELNAWIELRSRENRRNFDPVYYKSTAHCTTMSLSKREGYEVDRYYENYDRFTPVLGHQIKTYLEFIK